MADDPKPANILSLMSDFCNGPLIHACNHDPTIAVEALIIQAAIICNKSGGARDEFQTIVDSSWSMVVQIAAKHGSG